MKKLALIGKEIQHSKSPDLYRELISNDIQYDLLDYQESSFIPSVDDLFNKYDGINITSPYKQFFLNNVTLSASALKTNAINCLGKKGSVIIGENTDYLAIVNILKLWTLKYNSLQVLILGDGVMSKVTELVLLELEIPHMIASRKKTKDFAQIKCEDFFDDHLSNQKLIINTCSREYVFTSTLTKNILFWDYNYSILPHSSTLPANCLEYIDGLKLLELQAQLAIQFWSNTSNF